MGGLHLPDLIIVLVIALLILGPKMVQSVARDAGKAVGQAKKTKDQVLAELPVEEITNVTKKIPMSPQQAVQMLLTPENKEKPQEVKQEQPTKQD